MPPKLSAIIFILSILLIQTISYDWTLEDEDAKIAERHKEILVWVGRIPSYVDKQTRNGTIVPKPIYHSYAHCKMVMHTMFWHMCRTGPCWTGYDLELIDVVCHQNVKLPEDVIKNICCPPGFLD